MQLFITQSLRHTVLGRILHALSCLSVLLLPVTPALAVPAPRSFPIRVYINPNTVSKTGQNRDSLEEYRRYSLRQAVMDWNRLMVLLPDKPTDSKYAMVLRRQDGALPEELLSKLGFFILTRRREEADLVIEAVDGINLRGEDNPRLPATLSLFTLSPNYRIGKISVSLRRYSPREVYTNDLDLRLLVINQLGRVMGLPQTPDQKCNVMSPNRTECNSDSLAECKFRQIQQFACVAVEDEQLRQVEAQLLQGRWVGLGLHDYARNVTRRISAHLSNEYKERGDIYIKLLPTGELKEVKVGKSFGSPEVDQQVTTLVQGLSPFQPFPDTYKVPDFDLTLSIKNTPLIAPPGLSDYVNKLLRLVSNQLPDLGLVNPRGQIQLRLSEDGEVLAYKITQSFGNGDADQKVTRLLGTLPRFVPPPKLTIAARDDCFTEQQVDATLNFGVEVAGQTSRSTMLASCLQTNFIEEDATLSRSERDQQELKRFLDRSP
ncbi:TonB C-terminal domain-containing protein [Anthocerotibacter panamensis]|uniref:TonB C-terminal domain-containing protein n=1 Tax=Anthocerotibacter panamensis TaxID=2857077 RepID=UPI001C4044DA|nr:TonB C-terminal domain-containing protein [Anthocerotibacter panamensis]